MIVHINACHIPFFLFIGCSTFAFLKMLFYFLFQSSPWVSGPVVVEKSEIQSLLLLLISQVTQEPVTTEPQTKGRAKENLPSSGLNPKITPKNILLTSSQPSDIPTNAQPSQPQTAQTQNLDELLSYYKHST